MFPQGCCIIFHFVTWNVLRVIGFRLFKKKKRASEGKPLLDEIKKEPKKFPGKINVFEDTEKEKKLTSPLPERLELLPALLVRQTLNKDIFWFGVYLCVRARTQSVCVCVQERVWELSAALGGCQLSDFAARD